MRTSIRTALAVVFIGALAACAPATPPVTQITCAGLQGSLTVAPGLTSAPKAQTYSLDDSTQLKGCVDASDSGITSATVLSSSLVFPAASCQDAGTGAGSGLIRWDDGSTSAFTMISTPTSNVEARLDLRIVSGSFEGARGSINVAVTVTEGNCSSGGITAENIAGGELVLAI